MSKRITKAIAAYREFEPHAVMNRAGMQAALYAGASIWQTRGPWFITTLVGGLIGFAIGRL